jgi:hypothetical protein
MAMLRIPTEESGGKANLSQGAIGLGIDLATGITTYGVRNNQQVSRIYDRRRKKDIKVNGIKIPFWSKSLRTAINCQQAIPGLHFLGVDIFMDKKTGPTVVELNARPGLSIQICNRAGLKRRLERVTGLKIRDTSHALKVAKALFGESFVDKVTADEGLKIVQAIETVKIKSSSGKKFELMAKIDTGAYRSSIDRSVAQELGLLEPEIILFTRHYRSSLGRWHERQIVGLTFWLKGRKIKTTANVSNRTHLHTPFLMGRKDLQGFMVKPTPISTRMDIDWQT